MSLGGLCKFPHGLSFKGYLVGTVHDAVQDGIGQSRLIEPCVPGCYRQLTGDERGAAVQVAAADAANDEPERLNFMCRHCGGAMVVVETFIRGQSIRAPPCIGGSA